LTDPNQNGPGATGTTASSWPSPLRAWYAVGVFTLVTIMAFVDRQIMVLLVDPIKADLGISDTKMSFLLGFAFVMFYAFLSLPIARLADTRSRRAIIAVGVTLWSIMTAACGLAQNYWQLFLARMGVGSGEACNGPATFSLIADSFPPEKLAKATAVISSGFFIGNGVALIVGGAIIAKITAMPNFVLPVIGEIRPWQATFLVVGLPGVFLALLVRTVQEPKRRGVIKLRQGGGRGRPEALPLREIIKWLRGDWKTYAPMYGGMALRAMYGLGAAVWVPVFFTRTYDWSIAQVGLAVGLVQLIIAPIGLVSGGHLAEWLARRGYDDANMRVTLISTLTTVPTSILFPLMPNGYWSIGLYALNNFLVSLSPGPQNAALQTVTPNQIRAQATALYLFLFNLIGFGVGPLTVALYTDYLFRSEAMLRYSLSLNFAVLAPLACLVFWYVLKPYRLSVARAREREAAVV
jgi:MFS family permease